MRAPVSIRPWPALWIVLVAACGGSSSSDSGAVPSTTCSDAPLAAAMVRFPAALTGPGVLQLARTVRTAVTDRSRPHAAATTNPSKTRAVTMSRPVPPPTVMRKTDEPALDEPLTQESATFSDLGTVVTHAANGPHHYSKDSPWNCDETLAMLNDGTILDGTTFGATGQNIAIPVLEHRAWSNTDPRYVYGARNREWWRLDATNTSRSKLLKTYTSDGAGHAVSTVSFQGYEGTTDNADTGAVLIGVDASGSHRYPFLIDPKTGNVRCTIAQGGSYGQEVDNAMLSQDGRTILVQYTGTSIEAYSASDCSFLRRLSNNGNGHYDACVSTAGDQVIVQADGPLKMTRIADGSPTSYTVVYGIDANLDAHLSCRNIRRPGWVIVSSAATDPRSNALHRIFALQLDGSQTVEQFAWDHQDVANPQSPIAASSPSGTRVWWSVNWDERSGGVHSFVAGAQ